MIGTRHFAFNSDEVINLRASLWLKPLPSLIIYNSLLSFHHLICILSFHNLLQIHFMDFILLALSELIVLKQISFEVGLNLFIHFNSIELRNKHLLILFGQSKFFYCFNCLFIYSFLYRLIESRAFKSWTQSCFVTWYWSTLLFL